MKAFFLAGFFIVASLLCPPAAFSDSPQKDLPREQKKDSPKPDDAKLAPAITKPVPESIADLKAIQDQTKKVLEKVMRSVVGVQIGGASGSGVIVNTDGIVLTAGHVSGKPGQKCTIILPDGKRLEGKSLGRNSGIDSGMIQITSEGKWDACEMGQSKGLKPGQWCIAIGHPNGFQKGRTPVVRLGRILSLHPSSSSLNTDCTLVGGDSGGPLFDMEGKVIGIHSRIGPTITSNVHVPIKSYSDAWDKLAKGEDIDAGGAARVVINAYLGVTRDEDSKDCKLARVTEGSPAEKAGLLTGDVVTGFDGMEVKSYDDLLGFLSKKKPGDEVEVTVKRGNDLKNLKVKLDKRG